MSLGYALTHPDQMGAALDTTMFKKNMDEIVDGIITMVSIDDYGQVLKQYVQTLAEKLENADRHFRVLFEAGGPFAGIAPWLKEQKNNNSEFDLGYWLDFIKEAFTSLRIPQIKVKINLVIDEILAQIPILQTGKIIEEIKDFILVGLAELEAPLLSGKDDMQSHRSYRTAMVLRRNVERILDFVGDKIPTFNLGMSIKGLVNFVFDKLEEDEGISIISKISGIMDEKFGGLISAMKNLNSASMSVNINVEADLSPVEERELIWLDDNKVTPFKPVYTAHWWIDLTTNVLSFVSTILDFHRTSPFHEWLFLDAFTYVLNIIWQGIRTVFRACCPQFLQQHWQANFGVFLFSDFGDFCVQFILYLLASFGDLGNGYDFNNWVMGFATRIARYQTYVLFPRMIYHQTRSLWYLMEWKENGWAMRYTLPSTPKDQIETVLTEKIADCHSDPPETEGGVCWVSTYTWEDVVAWNGIDIEGDIDEGTVVVLPIPPESARATNGTDEFRARVNMNRLIWSVWVPTSFTSFITGLFYSGQSSWENYQIANLGDITTEMTAFLFVGPAIGLVAGLIMPFAVCDACASLIFEPDLITLSTVFVLLCFFVLVLTGAMASTNDLSADLNAGEEVTDASAFVVGMIAGPVVLVFGLTAVLLATSSDETALGWSGGLMMTLLTIVIYLVGGVIQVVLWWYYLNEGRDYYGDFKRLGSAKDSPYKLPYRKGESWNSGQAFHGIFSHYYHSPDNLFSNDFMENQDENTLASREGTVVHVYQDEEYGSFEKNYVEIRHLDWKEGYDPGTDEERVLTKASYVHIGPNNAFVNTHQRVLQGQHIANIDDTGVSAQNHLHFGITTEVQNRFKRSADGDAKVSIPVIYADESLERERNFPLLRDVDGKEHLPGKPLSLAYYESDNAEQDSPARPLFLATNQVNSHIHSLAINVNDLPPDGKITETLVFTTSVVNGHTHAVELNSDSMNTLLKHKRSDDQIDTLSSNGHIHQITLRDGLFEGGADSCTVSIAPIPGGRLLAMNPGPYDLLGKELILRVDDMATECYFLGAHRTSVIGDLALDRCPEFDEIEINDGGGVFNLLSNSPYSSSNPPLTAREGIIKLNESVIDAATPANTIAVNIRPVPVIVLETCKRGRKAKIELTYGAGNVFGLTDHNMVVEGSGAVDDIAQIQIADLVTLLRDSLNNSTVDYTELNVSSPASDSLNLDINSNAVSFEGSTRRLGDVFSNLYDGGNLKLSEKGSLPLGTGRLTINGVDSLGNPVAFPVPFIALPAYLVIDLDQAPFKDSGLTQSEMVVKIGASEQTVAFNTSDDTYQKIAGRVNSETEGVRAWINDDKLWLETVAAGMYVTLQVTKGTFTSSVAVGETPDIGSGLRDSTRISQGALRSLIDRARDLAVNNADLENEILTDARPKLQVDQVGNKIEITGLFHISQNPASLRVDDNRSSDEWVDAFKFVPKGDDDNILISDEIDQELKIAFPGQIQFKMGLIGTEKRRLELDADPARLELPPLIHLPKEGETIEFYLNDESDPVVVDIGGCANIKEIAKCICDAGEGYTARIAYRCAFESTRYGTDTDITLKDSSTTMGSPGLPSFGFVNLPRLETGIAKVDDHLEVPVVLFEPERMHGSKTKAPWEIEQSASHRIRALFWGWPAKKAFIPTIAAIQGKKLKLEVDAEVVELDFTGLTSIDNLPSLIERQSRWKLSVTRINNEIIMETVSRGAGTQINIPAQDLSAGYLDLTTVPGLDEGAVTGFGNVGYIDSVTGEEFANVIQMDGYCASFDHLIPSELEEVGGGPRFELSSPCGDVSGVSSTFTPAGDPLGVGLSLSGLDGHMFVDAVPLDLGYGGILNIDIDGSRRASCEFYGTPAKIKTTVDVTDATEIDWLKDKTLTFIIDGQQTQIDLSGFTFSDHESLIQILAEEIHQLRFSLGQQTGNIREFCIETRSKGHGSSIELDFTAYESLPSGGLFGITSSAGILVSGKGNVKNLSAVEPSETKAILLTALHRQISRNPVIKSADFDNSKVIVEVHSGSLTVHDGVNSGIIGFQNNGDSKLEAALSQNVKIEDPIFEFNWLDENIHPGRLRLSSKTKGDMSLSVVSSFKRDAGQWSSPNDSLGFYNQFVEEPWLVDSKPFYHLPLMRNAVTYDIGAHRKSWEPHLIPSISGVEIIEIDPHCPRGIITVYFKSSNRSIRWQSPTNTSTASDTVLTEDVVTTIVDTLGYWLKVRVVFANLPTGNRSDNINTSELTSALARTKLQISAAPAIARAIRTPFPDTLGNLKVTVIEPRSGGTQETVAEIDFSTVTFTSVATDNLNKILELLRSHLPQLQVWYHKDPTALLLHMETIGSGTEWKIELENTDTLLGLGFDKAAIVDGKIICRGRGNVGDSMQISRQEVAQLFEEASGRTLKVDEGVGRQPFLLETLDDSLVLTPTVGELSLVTEPVELAEKLNCETDNDGKIIISHEAGVSLDSGWIFVKFDGQLAAAVDLWGTKATISSTADVPSVEADVNDEINYLLDPASIFSFLIRVDGNEEFEFIGNGGGGILADPLKQATFDTNIDSIEKAVEFMAQKANCARIYLAPSQSNINEHQLVVQSRTTGRRSFLQIGVQWDAATVPPAGSIMGFAAGNNTVNGLGSIDDLSDTNYKDLAVAGSKNLFDMMLEARNRRAVEQNVFTAGTDTAIPDTLILTAIDPSATITLNTPPLMPGGVGATVANPTPDRIEAGFPTTIDVDEEAMAEIEFTGNNTQIVRSLFWAQPARAEVTLPVPTDVGLTATLQNINGTKLCLTINGQPTHEIEFKDLITVSDLAAQIEIQTRWQTFVRHRFVPVENGTEYHFEIATTKKGTGANIVVESDGSDALAFFTPSERIEAEGEGVVEDLANVTQDEYVAVMGKGYMGTSSLVEAATARSTAEWNEWAYNVDPGISASVDSANTEPFSLTAGMTLVASINGKGNSTATFDAAAATMEDTVTWPIADQDGKTCTITVDGGSAQTIAFPGPTTAIVDVINQMQAQVAGASFAQVSSHIVVTSDTQGTGSSIAFGAGTSNIIFDTPEAGTGDVVNIDATTSEEIKKVFEADVAGSVVTVRGDGGLTFTPGGPDKTIRFATSGTANSIIGIDAVSNLQYLQINSGRFGCNSSVIPLVSIDDLNFELSMQRGPAYRASVVIDHFKNNSDPIELTDVSKLWIRLNDNDLGSNLLRRAEIDVEFCPGEYTAEDVALMINKELMWAGVGCAGVFPDGVIVVESSIEGVAGSVELPINEDENINEEDSEIVSKLSLTGPIKARGWPKNWDGARNVRGYQSGNVTNYPATLDLPVCGFKSAVKTPTAVHWKFAKNHAIGTDVRWETAPLVLDPIWSMETLAQEVDTLLAGATDPSGTVGRIGIAKAAPDDTLIIEASERLSVLFSEDGTTFKTATVATPIHVGAGEDYEPEPGMNLRPTDIVRTFRCAYDFKGDGEWDGDHVDMKWIRPPISRTTGTQLQVDHYEQDVSGTMTKKVNHYLRGCEKWPRGRYLFGARAEAAKHQYGGQNEMILSGGVAPIGSGGKEVAFIHQAQYWIGLEHGNNFPLRIVKLDGDFLIEVTRW